MLIAILMSALGGTAVLAGVETPPLTRGEVSALRLSIKKYYVCGQCRKADGTVVRIALDLNPDGSIEGRPQQVGATGDDPAARDAIFRAGRRAIMRAAHAGAFEHLPTEKYDRWKRIIFKFTTEGLGRSQ